MAKSVQISEKIANYIRRGVGDSDIDTSKLTVFESRSLSTEPVKRTGGFHRNARVSRGTLEAMANWINKDNGSIPLQIMHNSEVLPVGRVFHASVTEDENGESELRTLFYLTEDQGQYIRDIQNSVIDEVSVSFMSEKAVCSECDFDYFGEDSSILNLMTLTCGNDHTIGVDGVHVRLAGLVDFTELSLVNRGAATNAKILSRAKQRLSEDTVKRLAASAAPLESRLFTNTFKMDENKGDLQMDKEALAQFTAAVTEVAQLKAQATLDASAKEALEKQVTELKASVDTLTKENTELKADPKAAETATKLAAAEKTATELQEAADKLLPHVKAALVASGAAETDLENKTFVELFAIVEEKGLKLHQVIGTEAMSSGAKDDVESDKAHAEYRKEAFKTKPRN